MTPDGVITFARVRRDSLIGRSVTAGAAITLMQLAAPGCSVGDGSGQVLGTLDIPDCWSGSFNLGPTFFAAVPYDNSVTIRIQNGDDYTAFSDGIMILVDNVHEVRGDAPYSPSLLGKALKVALPAGVTAPGAPVVANVAPALVHMTLYLQHSCPTQNVALNVLDTVSVDDQGNCVEPGLGPYILACNAPTSGVSALLDSGDGGGASTDGGTADGGSVAAEAGTLLPANAPVKRSSITFTSLFDGNPYESNAAESLTQATFDVYLGDPRDGCPGGVGPPPPCRGHLTGSFKFYFERGRPGQPFP